MSGHLPKTVKELNTEHPSKNAVTMPVDPALKEKDVARKMQFYGVIEGFRNGKLPANKQIDETLQYFNSHSPFDESKLSSDGRELISGFRKVVNDANELIKVKNQDELLQNFIWHTTKFDTQSHVENLKGANAPSSKEQAKSEGEEAVEHLRVLAKLVFTNSEVRKLLSDITVLGRDVAADVAEKAASKARPDEDALRRVEEPAPDAQWIAPDGSTRGPNDRAPDTGLGGKRDQLKEKKAQYDQTKHDTANLAQDQGQQSAQRAQQDVNPNDRDQQQRVAQDEASNAAGRTQDHAQKVKQNLVGNVPEEKKDQALQKKEEYKQRTKDYAKDKFPQERQDKFIYRLKKVVVEQQKHEDYNEAVDFFIDLLEKYKGRAADVKDQGAGKGMDVRRDPIYANAEMELRLLLERFANDTSMQPIIDAIDVMYADSRDDPELRGWWNNFGSYLRRVLQEEGYIMTDQCDQDGRQLKESGKKFWDHKYAGHRENLFHAIEEFFYAYNEDPLNKKLGVDVKNLVKNMALDGDGNLKYKPHLVQDLRHVIIPSIAKQIGYIPIPRAEYQDKQFDIVIENLTLELANLLPNMVEIENKNYFRLSPYDNQGDFQQHAFMIGFSQVQADLRDVAFYFKKKTGFPRLQDSGLADVVISGKGIYGSIKLETTPHSSHVFKVDHVDINIDDLKWKIRDSKHNFLYNALRTAASGIIKKAVCKAAEVAIRQALVQLDQQLTDIKEASDEASRRDDVTRKELVQQRLQQKKDDAAHKKEKAQETADKRQSQFKLVTARSQELINWESKASYVGKQGHLAEKTQSGTTTSQGQGWQAPVFDVVHGTPVNKEIVNEGNRASQRAHA